MFVLKQFVNLSVLDVELCKMIRVNCFFLDFLDNNFLNVPFCSSITMRETKGNTDEQTTTKVKNTLFHYTIFNSPSGNMPSTNI